jgi:hypothetical protein
MADLPRQTLLAMLTHHLFLLEVAFRKATTDEKLRQLRAVEISLADVAQ